MYTAPLRTLPLRTLAEASDSMGQPESLLSPAQFDALLETFARLWGRGYESTHSVVLKATSAAARTVQDRVDSYSQFDLYLGYTGIDKLTLYAKIQNLADEAPPYDASFPGIRAPYDFSQYDLRGRYFTVGFDYRF